MADQNAVSRWLEVTQKLYPGLLQGNKGVRLREVVNEYQSFQSLLESGDQPVNDENNDAHQAADHQHCGTRVTVDKPDGMSAAATTAQRKFLRAIIKIGCCVTLRNFLGNQIKVDETTDDGATPLHEAAEYGKCEDMEVLLDARPALKVDNHDLTPLHVAALSDKPNPEIAKLLIKYMIHENEEQTGYTLINFQSKRGNTALHFAAENEQVSLEFIQALENIDPSIKNEDSETAFHVAARAENPELIIFMLELFITAEKGWKMTDIDSENGSTLLEICARTGNAKAVALLIKYGADIPNKVSFDLIDESLKKVAMNEKLLDVYRTITENCVHCERLKAPYHEKRNYPRKATEPDAYAQKQRDIMLKLLSTENDEGRNVLEHAIAKGAEVFLQQIVNTPNVFIMTSDRSIVVKYDVTDFIISRERSNGCPVRWLRRNTAVPSDNEAPPSAEGRSAPEHSYLELITRKGGMWEKTDILDVEPFLAITQPICACIQLVYSLFFLIQLVYMIGFSVCNMPSYCSLIDSFNLSLPEFNASLMCKFQSSGLSPIPSWIWLIWPAAWFIVLICTSVTARDKSRQNWRYFASPRFLFLIVMILWYAFSELDAVCYLSLTSLVNLSGWLVTMSFFIHTLETVNIFLSLVKEIIVKDILRKFGVVFVFILISFSSAVHVLRKSSLRGHRTYTDTVYNLFASALTIGEFIQDTLEDSAHDVEQKLLF